MSWLTVPKLVLLALLVSFVVDVRSDILPYEPVEMLKTHLDKQTHNKESPWSKFEGAGSRELKNWTSIMRKNIRGYLSKVRGVSVMFLRGDDVMVEKMAHGMQKNTSITIPYVNLMSLIGITLPILLENYKTSVLTDPIGRVLKGADRENPVVKGHEQQSCLDLLNKLPKTSSDVLQDPQLIQALNSNGKLLLYVANTVLGKSAKEAWLDALLSAGMEEAKLDDQGALITSLNDLVQYVLTIQHGFEMGPAAPQSKAYAPENGRYLFSWWFNCPVGNVNGDCLLPKIPPDTMFNLSPGLRIYVSPHLRLSLIITNSSSVSRAKQSLTVADILHEDGLIWSQLYSVIDPTSRAAPPTQGTQGSQEGWTWSRILYWTWPVIVFLFFILSSHVWVYWMFHGFWYVVGFFVKRTHTPRPKTAKQE